MKQCQFSHLGFHLQSMFININPEVTTMFYRSIVLILCLLPVIANAKQMGGQLETEVNGKKLSFPILKTDIAADIQGDLATVTVTQTFANPLNEAVHATYLFPLNKGAAVYEMFMEVGSERIKAQIQEINQAKATFNKAKKEGKSAALLEQHRPNMFTQNIANLMPGLPIKVTMRYVQNVPRVDNEYQLVVPLVVGPRYQPQGAGKPPVAVNTESNETSAPTFGKWELEALPDYPEVFGLDIPEEIDAKRVSINIQLQAGMPINTAYSNTHQLNHKQITLQDWNISLANGRTIDNRDFVLQYSLSGNQSQAGLLAHRDERGGFFSLLLEPPAVPAAKDITPREMVFVLDCSGSMNGLPMQASKAFMREALKNLRATDSFRIIRFSDRATEFSTAPLPATPQNIGSGIRYTNQLRGMGGTEMISGISQALSPAVPDGAIRIVVFLTDGYIGNEHTILSYINQNISDARLYSFGVGTSVNRYLLEEMARTGRGFVRYMDPTDDVDEVAKMLATRLQSPVLTDIRIDWGSVKPQEVNPSPIPDLFAGQSLRVMGRYAKPGNYTVTVHGKVNGRPATLPMQVNLPEHSKDSEAIALVWARSKVKSLMEKFSMPINKRDLSDDQLKSQVTQLGLDFSLVTKWTAFVAVSERIYNSAPELTHNKNVPLPMVKGVTELAYPQNNAPVQATPSFHGYSAPEPAAYLGLGLLGTILGIWWLRRRQPKLVTI